MRSGMVPMIPWSMLLLGGCVGINPEWGEPVAATAWTPGGRCDADAGTEEGHDGEDDRSASGTGDASGGEACGVVESEACGEGLVACTSEGGWFCADLREHDEHCGACFNDCFAHGNAMCVEGECWCRGGPWMKLCAPGCVDTRIDPAGCGVLCVDCRVEYGEDARCDTGICRAAFGE